MSYLSDTFCGRRQTVLGKSCAAKKTADRQRVSLLFLPRNFPSRTSQVNFSVLVPNYRHCLQWWQIRKLAFRTTDSPARIFPRQGRNYFDARYLPRKSDLITIPSYGILTHLFISRHESLNIYQLYFARDQSLRYGGTRNCTYLQLRESHLSIQIFEFTFRKRFTIENSYQTHNVKNNERIEIIKTHRLHHVESSSVYHSSFARSSNLLSAAVLAREDRSLGALNREERSTLFRLCAVVSTTTENPPDPPRPAVPLCLRSIDFIQPLYRELTSSLRLRCMRDRAFREFSRPSRVAYNRPTDRRAVHVAGSGSWWLVGARSNRTERSRTRPNAAEAVSSSERGRPTNSRMRIRASHLDATDTWSANFRA